MVLWITVLLEVTCCSSATAALARMWREADITGSCELSAWLEVEHSAMFAGDAWAFSSGIPVETAAPALRRSRPSRTCLIRGRRLPLSEAPVYAVELWVCDSDSRNSRHPEELETKNNVLFPKSTVMTRAQCFAGRKHVTAGSVQSHSSLPALNQWVCYSEPLVYTAMRPNRVHMDTQVGQFDTPDQIPC